jgi:putative polyhydroxyalkanoic acid system protein
LHEHAEGCAGRARSDAHNSRPSPAHDVLEHPCPASISATPIPSPPTRRARPSRTCPKLDERFDITSRWQGDRLQFSRSGVDGAIELLPGEVRVTAELGFLLSAMQGMVESEIKRVLSERLD